jgi:hypothetical protein
MLPIYEAIDIIKIIPQTVGHTQPWVVLANTPNGLKPFVAKLYTTEQVENNNSVTNEIICNALASQFDLKVPTCALIDIPEALQFQKPGDYQIQYSNADPRLKFATEMLSDVIAAVPSLSKSDYSKRISLDTLFAFDNMICNADRGQQKTNLLISSKDAFLIDHEYAFNKNNIIGVDWNSFQIERKFTQYHFFYPYLKNSWKTKKRHYFDEFQEYLTRLNINQLDNFFRQLSDEGFDTQSIAISNWLNQLKQNSTIFVNSLKESLE